LANSSGSDVVTADAVPDWTAMRGRVRVDGELWCEGTTANSQHSLGAKLAYASAGEKLDAGELISTGTMPGCCGLELDRWIQPGQTVELEIDGIGTLANRVSPACSPTGAWPARTKADQKSPVTGDCHAGICGSRGLRCPRPPDTLGSSSARQTHGRSMRTEAWSRRCSGKRCGGTLPRPRRTGRA
jgi:hypothetical protein